MVTGRRLISRPATLNRGNDFRAISRLRRGYSCSVIDGMHNSMNQTTQVRAAMPSIIAAA
jgi:hypothetical protein